MKNRFDNFFKKKTKHVRLIHIPQHWHSGKCTLETWKLTFPQSSCAPACSSCICRSHKLKTVWLSFPGWIAKETIWNYIIYTRRLPSISRELRSVRKSHAPKFHLCDSPCAATQGWGDGHSQQVHGGRGLQRGDIRREVSVAIKRWHLRPLWWQRHVCILTVLPTVRLLSPKCDLWDNCIISYNCISINSSLKIKRVIKKPPCQS